MSTDPLHTAAHVDRMDALLRAWLDDPQVCLVIGTWNDGAVAELFTESHTSLSGQRYDGRFIGIRDLHLPRQRHHCHLDLARIHALQLKIAPNVCFGFEPSLELRFLRTGSGGTPTDCHAIAVMPATTYTGGRPNRPMIAPFLQRFVEQAQRHPDLFVVDIDPSCQTSALLQAIAEELGVETTQVAAHLSPPTSPDEAPAIPDPVILEFLGEALRLPDSTLVIYRERTLIEFKTSDLEGVHRYEEAGHVSWQIGGLRQSHCHLDLSAVDRIEFSAQPVPCQGNRLNYTVWFLVSAAVGNPFRRDGYFSIVFDHPYHGSSVRWDCLNAIRTLYERYADQAWVRADAGWQQAYAAMQAGREPESPSHPAESANTRQPASP